MIRFFENPHSERKEHLVKQEQDLANGEVTPKDRLQNQIRLATETFGKIKGFVDLDTEEARNNIMLFWAEEKFSQLYREIEDSKEFEIHSRLHGNIFDITSDDVIYYKENGKLPE